jgi:hypothetical protein
MRIALTAVIAAALAILASAGVYGASQPAASQAKTAVITYGSK